jgi:hypothetical protein
MVEDWDDYPNFSAGEFMCPASGESRMQKSTMDKLQALRTEYGKVMRIARGGGYRSAEYSSDELSAHRIGHGVDPLIPAEDVDLIVKLSYKHGFTGRGIKNSGGSTRLHLDDAPAHLPHRPRPWLWTYRD